MTRLPKLQGVIITVAFIFLVSILIGCSSGENLQSQISGTWQRAQNEGIVEINIKNDPKQLKINDKIYTATVEKVDKGNYSVFLKVENVNGQIEDWNLRQIWDDNGSSFKLAFNKNGTKEILESKRGS
jgi:hypothetical protein